MYFPVTAERAAFESWTPGCADKSAVLVFNMGTDGLKQLGTYQIDKDKARLEKLRFGKDLDHFDQRPVFHSLFGICQAFFVL